MIRWQVVFKDFTITELILDDNAWLSHIRKNVEQLRREDVLEKKASSEQTLNFAHNDGWNEFLHFFSGLLSALSVND